MGGGIAQTVAGAGIPVILRELTPELAEAAKANITKGLKRAVDKEKLTAAKMNAILDHIAVTDDLNSLADADLVIEAIVEDLDKKKELFAALSEICRPTTTMATNTSALSITAIAEACARPERFVGMHFFNPVPVMALVEVIRGQRTDAATIATAKSFAERIGKTPVLVNEAPGFIVNRLLIPYINEAALAAGDGVASREDIDRAMMLGAAHPMGPLALADMIGLDVVVDILKTLESELKDPKYAASPLLKELVAAGALGRKSGRGFFVYDRKG